jgi:hypothetical protein
MNDFLHNMVDTGDRILSTNCHTDIFGSGNVHRQGTEIRLSDLPTLKMTVLRTTYSVVLHLVHRQDFWFSAFRTPKIRVEIWRVTIATATQTTSFFLSLFLDSSFFFILSS